MDESQKARLLRRDPQLAGLVERLAQDVPEGAATLLEWSMARDNERRSLAIEALERYRELNLLYDLAERSSSLDPVAVIRVATAEVERLIRRGASMALIVDQDGRWLEGVVGDEAQGAASPARFRVGEGIVGGVAASGEGEIINDCRADPRALEAETALGALMVAPLSARGKVLGVLIATAPQGAGFTAGEHRMLSAVAALTAPALDAAISHERALGLARSREEELRRQLDELRNEVEERRREERVREITGSDYFRTLRQQADSLRRALDVDTLAGDQ